MNSSVPARAEQLEERRLDAGEHRARSLHLVQADSLVLLGSRADRVERDLNLDPRVEQVEHGLVDADVALDPADERLVAAAEVEALGLGRGEATFSSGSMPSGRCSATSGTVSPRPFGYCSVTTIGTPSASAPSIRVAVAFATRVEVRDRLAEALLDVDHDQRRPLRLELAAHEATPRAKLRWR